MDKLEDWWKFLFLCVMFNCVGKITKEAQWCGLGLESCPYDPRWRVPWRVEHWLLKVATSNRESVRNELLSLPVCPLFLTFTHSKVPPLQSHRIYAQWSQVYTFWSLVNVNVAKPFLFFYLVDKMRRRGQERDNAMAKMTQKLQKRQKITSISFPSLLKGKACHMAGSLAFQKESKQNQPPNNHKTNKNQRILIVKLLCIFVSAQYPTYQIVMSRQPKWQLRIWCSLLTTHAVSEFWIYQNLQSFKPGINGGHSTVQSQLYPYPTRLAPTIFRPQPSCFSPLAQ